MGRVAPDADRHDLPYCGVGCNLTLHVQDNQIVKVTSPDDHDITRGNLCIKGRFGFQHVQAPAADTPRVEALPAGRSWPKRQAGSSYIRRTSPDRVAPLRAA